MSQLRLEDVFTYKNESIHIIGCGATGSNLAYHLAKSGCSLVLWDDDIVSDVNLSNQFFKSQDIGKNKALALSENLEYITGNIGEFTVKDICVNETNVKFLAGYVFICVDKMSIRTMLWSKMKNNINIVSIIDIRMGINEGRIYYVNPTTGYGEKIYKESLYKDDEVATLHIKACHKTSVGVTAVGLVSYAVWMFYNIVKGKFVSAILEIMFDTPDLLLTKDD